MAADVQQLHRISQLTISATCAGHRDSRSGGAEM